MTADVGSVYKMKRTAEQEADYTRLYAACKKRLTQVSLAAPEELHHILEVLNAAHVKPVAAELQKATNELHQAEYALYLAACRVEKIEPSLQDFEADNIPDGVIDIMERQQNGEAA